MASAKATSSFFVGAHPLWEFSPDLGKTSATTRMRGAHGRVDGEDVLFGRTATLGFFVRKRKTLVVCAIDGDLRSSRPHAGTPPIALNFEAGSYRSRSRAGTPPGGVNRIKALPNRQYIIPFIQKHGSTANMLAVSSAAYANDYGRDFKTQPFRKGFCRANST